MKVYKGLLPLILLSLNSCGTVEKLNQLVNESTCAIYDNIDAVQNSTRAVRQNAQLVSESTIVIHENEQIIEKMSKE